MYIRKTQNQKKKTGGYYLTYRLVESQRIGKKAHQRILFRKRKPRPKDVVFSYEIKGRRTNPASPNENGDVEQSHYRFKKAVDQALMLRGRRDVSSRREYKQTASKMLPV